MRLQFPATASIPFQYKPHNRLVWFLPTFHPYTISFSPFFDLLVICQLSQYPALLPTTYIKEVLGQIRRGLGWLRLTPCLPARVCRHWSDVVGLLLLAGGTEQGFAYYKQNRRAILSRRCLWGSARLALIEPIA